MYEDLYLVSNCDTHCKMTGSLSFVLCLQMCSMIIFYTIIQQNYSGGMQYNNFEHF